MPTEPHLFRGPNAAVCCAVHRGHEGWRPLPEGAAARLRADLAELDLVAPTEPLCETCRGIAARRTRMLTGGDA